MRRYGNAHEVSKYVSFSLEDRTLDFEFMDSAEKSWFDKGINRCLVAIAQAYQRGLVGEDMRRFVLLVTDGVS